MTNKTDAVKRASFAAGRAKVFEGLFEILDTHVSNLRFDSPEFERMMPILERLEATQTAHEQERDFFLSLA